MRATNVNSLLAVSVLLITMVCTTVPAWARVDISVAQVGDPCDSRVVISWDATSETNLVRAFALDIRLDNDANIVGVFGLSADYWVYPGTIQIAADGTISYIGTMSAEESDLPSGTLPGPPDGNGVTLEAASLYAPVGIGSPNAPPRFGDLAEIIVSKSTCLTISANVVRAGSTGVVMEDPKEIVEVNFPGLFCVDIPCGGCNPLCMKTSAPEYSDWEALGKPACWCYSRQCRGDINGIKHGPFWVNIFDLDPFKAGFNKRDVLLPPGGECCDLDHRKYGPFRCNIFDLDIFKKYFNKPEAAVPECDKTNYNYWETP